MHLNKKNGYFVSALDSVGDPIRTNLWKMQFDFTELRRYEENLGANFNVFDSERLSLMVKGYQPPVIEMNTQEIYFHGGAKKVVPSTQEQDDTVVITIQENNRLTGYQNIMRWMQYCINTFAYSPEAIGEETKILSNNQFSNVYGYGSPIYKNKDDEVIGNFFVNTNTIAVDHYDYSSGEVIMRISYINIFPVKITPPKLEYNSVNLYQFQVEFKYSRHVLTIPTGKGRLTAPTSSAYLSQSPVQWGNSN